jgi:hypothetical protein
MKELKSIAYPQTPVTPPPKRKLRGTKRWAIAQGRGTNPRQAMQNSNTENAVHRIIAAIKTRYLKTGDVYFERDYKQDKEESIFDMHCFMCSTFLIRLDCVLYYDFEVEFAFDNCPFEAEIRAMLNAGPLDTQAKEITLQPDFKAYYEHVLSYHRAEFIHTF